MSLQESIRRILREDEYSPAGKEVIWWFPPGWIVRDLKPEGNWSWSQSEERWVEYTVQNIQAIDIPVLESVQLNAISSQDIGVL